MKKYFVLLIGILAATIIQGQNLSVKDKQEILTVLEEQRIAWNRGDIEGYMNGYWNSDSLRFISKNGITYGWQETLARYRKGYPTVEMMGKLTFEVISVEKLNEESAFMVGKWSLLKLENSVSGYFTLIWRKISGKWVVVLDHTS